MATTLKIRVSINGSSSDYRLPVGVRTASDLAASSRFREDFGLGDNITVLVNNSATTRAIATGDVITVQTNAARKAAARPRVNVSINGSTESYFLPVGVTTAADLAASSRFREDFSLGDNITVLVNGVASTGRLATNDNISVQTNAARKAA